MRFHSLVIISCALLHQESSAMSKSPLNQAIACGASACITYTIMSDWLGTIYSPAQTVAVSLAIDTGIILCHAMQNNSPSRIMSNTLISAGIYCLCVRPFFRRTSPKKNSITITQSCNKEIYKDPSFDDPSHSKNEYAMNNEYEERFD